MKAQYGILRFKKYKGPAISPIEAHNERTKEQYASNPDIDTSWSRFLVHVDNSREKGIRALPALQKFQGVRKIRLDFAVRLAFEKLRAGGDKCFHHSHAVLADTAVGGGYHAVGFFPVFALWLHQMEVVAAPARVDVRVAGVLLLGALVVGLQRPGWACLVFGEA